MNSKVLESFLIPNTDKEIDQIKKVIENVYAYKKDNNCQLCAGCFEMQMRGIDMNPRDVLTPADKIFKNENWSFIKNAKKYKLSEDLKGDVSKILKNAGNHSRFYASVGWKGYNSGHVFNVINLDDNIYVIDCMHNKMILLEDDDFYFVEADYKRSWLMRSDNAQLDKNKMKYNSEKYMIPWKDGDEKYL